MAKSKPKRPKTRPVVERPLVRCPACGSTDRTRYYRTRRLEYAGLDAEGKPYSAVVWRWCRCKSCGQARVERSYEYAGEGGPADG